MGFRSRINKSKSSSPSPSSQMFNMEDLQAAINAGAKEIFVNWIQSKAQSIKVRNNKVHCMMDWGDGALIPLTVEKTPGVNEWFWCDAGAPAAGFSPRRRFTDKDFMFWEFEVPAPLREAINELK